MDQEEQGRCTCAWPSLSDLRVIPSSLLSFPTRASCLILTAHRFENLTSNFASKLRRLATSDKVILNGGVAAYIQAVLAPELAVMLVMDDMRTDEEDARAILRDSMDIGNLLNEEEDDIIDVVEPDKDPLGLASDV